MLELLRSLTLSLLIFLLPSSGLSAALSKWFSVNIVELSKNIKILIHDKHDKHVFEWRISSFSLSFIIIINIMTRENEIEIFDQSDVIFSNILREKKRDVDKLINELFSIFSNYVSILIIQKFRISRRVSTKVANFVFIISIIFLLFTFSDNNRSY